MEDVNQTTHQRCKQAVLAELIAAGCTPDNPIALYLVGPTLVAAYRIYRRQPRALNVAPSLGSCALPLHPALSNQRGVASWLGKSRFALSSA